MSTEQNTTPVASIDTSVDRTYVNPENFSLTAQVPACHLHLDEVKARGWGRFAFALLDDAAIQVESSNGVSPRCYPVVAVEAAEKTEAFAEAQAQAAEETRQREEEKAEKAAAEEARLAAQMPRREDPPYDECVGRAYLKARGWTEGHIKRLLGEADISDPLGRGRWQDLWDRQRMLQAEETDTKLQKRRESWQAKKDAAKAERISEQVEAGYAVFRKRGEEWVLEGTGLTVGSTVKVRLKSGDTIEKTVARVVSTDADGLVTAAPVDERAVQRAREEAERQASWRQARLESEYAIFRRRGCDWVLEGPGLAEGSTVKVRLRSGEVIDKRVARVLSTAADGMVTATAMDDRAAAEWEKWRIAERGLPVGEPPLPEGTDRNEAAGECRWCGVQVEAGTGSSRYRQCRGNPCTCGGMELWQPCEYGGRSWREWECRTCIWRFKYRLNGSDLDPLPWADLGWAADDVRLAIAAGFAADEFDAGEPVTAEQREVWRTMAALRPRRG